LTCAFGIPETIDFHRMLLIAIEYATSERVSEVSHCDCDEKSAIFHQHMDIRVPYI